MKIWRRRAASNSVKPVLQLDQACGVATSTIASLELGSFSARTHVESISPASGPGTRLLRRGVVELRKFAIEVWR